MGVPGIDGVSGPKGKRVRTLWCLFYLGNRNHLPKPPQMLL